MKASFLSDHSSNPLQARPSDVLNNKYLTMYNHAVQDCHGVASDEDELNTWTRQEESIVPSGGPENRRFVDLDQYMSDDELALPRREDGLRVKQHPWENQRQIHYDESHDDQARDEDEYTAMDNGLDELEDQDELADYPSQEGGDNDDTWASPLTPRSLSSAFSSPQSSRPPSPDESKTLFARSEDEQAEIQSEMSSLYRAVPDLRGKYQLLDRLGTGTFSAVYKAIDLTYDEWDNDPWLGNHPPESSAFYQSAGPAYKGRGGRGPTRKKRSAIGNGDVDMDAEDEAHVNQYPPTVYVAIKRIYTTSSPDRIKNELRILEICRGCRHTSQVITAFRHRDQVVIILPYQRNLDFREFYQNLHPEGIKCYFRCLFRALRDIHLRGIIHRDVKPANFLYDPFTGIGTLCDFGLASQMKNESKYGPCLHTQPFPDYPHGRNCSVDDAKRFQVKTAQKEARAKSALPAEKVGYPDNDRRPVSKANRAGTRGFRAPEVLLKCHYQTGAIDVWSAGVIFLCFLAGKFPIFNSNDDVEALMEIAVILGKRNTERVATLHGRTFATNVPDLQPEGISWQDFVQKLNPGITTPRKYDMRYYPHNSKHRDGRRSSNPTVPPPTSSSPPSSFDLPSQSVPGATNNPNTISERYMNPPSAERHAKDMRNAFDLLEAMLHSESTKRITPRGVLYHPFLSEPGVDPKTEGDDAFVPHPPGEGVCAELHSRDDVTEQMFVQVLRRVDTMSDDDDEEEEENVSLDGDELADLNEGDLEVDEYGQRWMKHHLPCMPGQGMVIGTRPCEFHRGPLYGFE